MGLIYRIMKTLTDRIRHRLAALDKTARGASLEAGLSASFIRNIFEGKATAPNATNLAKLARVLQTDEAWLLHGTSPDGVIHEPIDLDDAPDFDEMTGEGPQDRHKYRQLEPGEIVERNVVGGLGSGADGTVVMVNGQATDEVRDVWRMPPEYVRTELSARESDLDIITVKGDSMQPTILPGDKVMINRTQGLSGDGIYALHDGTGPSVKRLQVMIGTDPIRVRVLSDNPKHENYDVALTDLHIIGRVIWRGTRL